MQNVEIYFFDTIVPDDFFFPSQRSRLEDFAKDRPNGALGPLIPGSEQEIKNWIARNASLQCTASYLDIARYSRRAYTHARMCHCPVTLIWRNWHQEGAERGSNDWDKPE